MRYFLIVLLLLTLPLQLSAQDLAPKEAKKRIQQRGVDFSRTAFINAVIDGDAKLTRLFLKAGIDPDSEYQSPVADLEMPAAGFALNHPAVLEVLLQNGADPNATGISLAGMSDRLIHSAVDHPDALKTLITYGAQIDVKASDGMEAIHHAIMSDTTAEVRNRSLRILLKNGADPEALVVGGRLEGATPMLLCAAQGRPNAVRVLAKNGADVSLDPSGWKSPEGKTLATIARQAGNEETARVLEELMK